MILMAIIIILVLFLIKVNLTSIPVIDYSTPELETFGNIRSELKYAGEMAMWEDNYTVLYYFSDFLNNKSDLEMFYSISEFNDSVLNITLVNFLDEAIQDVNITQNLTDETKQISSMPQGGTDYVNFTWFGSETNFEINITYKGSDSGNTTRQKFMAKAGPSRYLTVFYDLKLNFGESYIKDKFSVSGEETA